MRPSVGLIIGSQLLHEVSTGNQLLFKPEIVIFLHRMCDTFRYLILCARSQIASGKIYAGFNTPGGEYGITAESV